MKKQPLVLLSLIALWACPATSFGQAPPPLGNAASFALFTAIGAVNNVGPSVINGDIGTGAGAFNGFPPGTVNGNIYLPGNTYATQAATDVQTAYGYFSANIPCVTPLALYGGTPAVTLLPGSYCVTGATTLAGTLILDAQGVPNAKFYLRVVGGALTTGANSTVLLANGAKANNVYWQISGGQVTLGQNSTMQGTLLVDGAISMSLGARLIGRGLSRAGAISPTTSTASLPVVTSTSWLGLAFGGTGTTDWFTPANWSDGVPTTTLDAIVPTGTSPFPVLAGGNAVAKSLTIATNASLTQSAGTLDVKGNLDNAGTIAATGGTVLLSGTSAQALGGTGSTQLWSLTLNNTNGATLAGAVGIHGILTPSAGTLATNNQNLTLRSDATGTALVNNSGTGSVSGAVTMQRYIAPNINTGLGYRHYSSPVSNTTLSDLATPGFVPVFTQLYNTQGNTATPFPNVFGFDEARITTAAPGFDQGFFVPAGTAPMDVMAGYTVNIRANQVVDLSGTLNNGPQSRTNLSRGTGAQSGWHLLGNPYPSPIDFSQTAGVTRTNMDDAIYVFQSIGQYAGGYRTYVNGAGFPQLSAMQGFFAHVSAGQTSGSMSLNNAVRVTSLAAQPAFNRNTADLRPLVQVQLQSGATGALDEAYVYFEAGATPAFDAHYDAYKLPNPSGLSVSSRTAADELSVNGLGLLAGATTVALNVQVPAAGSYTLTAAALRNFAPGTQVLLLDTQTGTRTNLSQQPSYAFSTSSTALPGRFSLYFAPAGALASAPQALGASVLVFPNPAHGRCTLLLPAALGTAPVAIAISNQLGQRVAARTVAMTAAGASTEFDLAGLAPGIYSLQLRSAAGQVTKRVVVE